MSAGGQNGLFIGTGAGITLIALMVLQSFVGSGLLGTRPGTLPNTTCNTRYRA